jgi:plastocyanin
MSEQTGAGITPREIPIGILYKEDSKGNVDIKINPATHVKQGEHVNFELHPSGHGKHFTVHFKGDNPFEDNGPLHTQNAKTGKCHGKQGEYEYTVEIHTHDGRRITIDPVIIVDPK